MTPIVMHLTGGGGGIGDTVVALYAACGMAQATGREVVYYARYRQWIDRASFPGVEIRDHQEIGVDASGGWEGPHGYHAATRTARSRLWAYCTNLANAYRLPPFEGVRPHLPPPPVTSGQPYAVLAPFTSAWPAREWPAWKWTAVAHNLAARGIRPVGVGTREQRHRLAATLPGHECHYGTTADQVLDIMQGAMVVVANDSGLAHVGGLLDVPTVAVHAGSLPHAYLFERGNSISSVTSGLRLPRADANADALGTITPARVVAGVTDLLASSLTA